MGAFFRAPGRRGSSVGSSKTGATDQQGHREVVSVSRRRRAYSPQVVHELRSW